MATSEQAALISVAVAQKSQGPNVEATPLVDASGRRNLFTVDIAPPLPNELWLDFKVESRRSFPKNPGVLRIVIQDGEQVLDTFGTVIGKSAKPSVAERSVNVLAARTSLPDTMLVTIAVEALLMPDGTDPDTIDPMTAEVSEERYSLAVATPPVRINVKSAAAPPPAAPAAAAPEEPGAAAAGPPAEASRKRHQRRIMNIVVIGAHPDDCEVYAAWCTATQMASQAGNRVLCIAD